MVDKEMRGYHLFDLYTMFVHTCMGLWGIHTLKALVCLLCTFLFLSGMGEIDVGGYHLFNLYMLCLFRLVWGRQTCGGHHLFDFYNIFVQTGMGDTNVGGHHLFHLYTVFVQTGMRGYHFHLSSCLLPADSWISRICAMSTEPPLLPGQLRQPRRSDLSVTSTLQSVNW